MRSGMEVVPLTGHWSLSAIHWWIWDCLGSHEKGFVEILNHRGSTEFVKKKQQRMWKRKTIEYTSSCTGPTTSVSFNEYPDDALYDY